MAPRIYAIFRHIDPPDRPELTILFRGNVELGDFKIIISAKGILREPSGLYNLPGYRTCPACTTLYDLYEEQYPLRRGR